MHALEIHTIILIMSVPATRGLLRHLQNCSNYCKLLSDPSNNRRSDCDCYSNDEYKVRSTKQALRDPEIEIEHSEIYYDPVKNKFHQDSPHHEHMYFVNPIPNFKSTDIESKIFKTKQYHRSISTHDKNRQINNSENAEQSLHEIITINEIPLYLDIDLYEAKNKTHHEVLGDIFENFRFIEKNLSDCFNLQIFIFLKSTDNFNETNTNWGRNAKQYDKLSNSEVLTEIQNRCNQTGNIVEQSVYDIKRRTASKRNSMLSKETNKTLYENLRPNETGTFISHDNAILITKPYKEASDLEGHIPAVPTMQNNHDTRDPGEEDTTIAAMNQLKNYVNDNTETRFNHTEPKNSNTTIHFMELSKNSSKEHNLAAQTKFNRSITDATETIDSTVETNSESTYSQNLTKYRRNDVITTIPSYITNTNNFENTITDVTSRAEYQEGEYLIPKVITRELPNNTVQSVVDGYEVIPNSDFISSTTSMVSTTELSQPGTESVLKQNIDFGQFTNRTVSQVNKGVDIKGHLYFLYENHQIPARFIQEKDGNIHLAIDGFSLCEKYLQQENKSAFMSLLCNCIILENCNHN